jgi:hypothetical protein
MPPRPPAIMVQILSKRIFCAPSGRKRAANGAPLSVGKDALHQSLDDLVTVGQGVYGNRDLVKDEAVDRVVEQGDLLLAAWQAHSRVEGDVVCESVAQPGGDSQLNVRPSCCLQAKFEEGERSIAV